jgi:hypothetical protein
MIIYVVIFMDNTDNTYGCIGVYKTLDDANKSLEAQKKLDYEDDLDYDYKIDHKELE